MVMYDDPQGQGFWQDGQGNWHGPDEPPPGGNPYYVPPSSTPTPPQTISDNRTPEQVIADIKAKQVPPPMTEAERQEAARLTENYRKLKESGKKESKGTPVVFTPFKPSNGYQGATSERATSTAMLTPEQMKRMEAATDAQFRYGIGSLPVVGTAFYWQDMSPVERAVSVAWDIASVLPYGNMIKALKPASAVQKSAVRQIIGEGAEFIDAKVAPELKPAYKTLMTDAAHYSDDVLQQAQLKKKLVEASGAKILRKEQTAILQKQLGKVEARIPQAEKRLQDSARSFSEQAERVLKADSPDEIARLRDLPGEMPRRVQAAVKQVTEPRRAEIIKAEIKSVDRELGLAGNEYKKRALQFKRLNLQNELKAEILADTESIKVNMDREAAHIRRLQELRSKPYQNKPLIDRELAQSYKRLQAHVDDFNTSLRNTEMTKVSSRNYETPMGKKRTAYSFESERGGLATKTRTRVPVKPGTSLSGAGTQLTVEQMLGRATAAQVAKNAFAHEEMGTYKQPKAIPEAGKSPAEFQTPKESGQNVPATGPETGGQTSTTPETIDISKTGGETILDRPPRPEPNPVPPPTPQPEPGPNPKLVPPLNPTPGKPFVPETPKTPFRPIPPGGIGKPTDEEKRRIIESAPGAIAWPQGKLNDQAVWHVVIEPYSEARHYIVVGRQPAGAKIYQGAGQAYKSITQLSGNSPSSPTKLEGGAVDPVIYTSNGKVKIAFVHDDSVPKKRYAKRFSKQRAMVQPSEIAPDVVVTRVGGKTRQHIRIV